MYRLTVSTSKSLQHIEDCAGPFIVTVHTLSVPSTLTRVGTADPTKHEWPLCYPHRVLPMVPRNLKYASFLYVHRYSYSTVA